MASKILRIKLSTILERFYTDQENVQTLNKNGAEESSLTFHKAITDHDVTIIFKPP